LDEIKQQLPKNLWDMVGPTMPQILRLEEELYLSQGDQK
jgi:hypothetical protein